MFQSIHIFSSTIFPGAGCVLSERRLHHSGVPENESAASFDNHDDCRKTIGYPRSFVRRHPTCDMKRMTFTCKASSNNHRRNPDFSRQNKGFSRGRNRQNQEREKSENPEDNDIMSSKNGPLLSLSSNSRYHATATPGQREKEIVELFRKVQAQLRERAAIKEEKKIEASQQGQGEKGTVDSLLKLLRKHSGDQGRRGDGEEEFVTEEPERTGIFDEEKNSNLFVTNSIATDEDVQEPETLISSRPASKFNRRSPVPRVKFQPVYSAVENTDKDSTAKGAAKKKEISIAKTALEPLFFDEREEPFEDDLSGSSDIDEMEEEIEEAPIVENPDLSSMKLLELRELAKSHSVKGYSKLKKADLVKLLEGMM